MVINGRECGFRFTISASIEVAELCPDKDISKLGELFKEESFKNSVIQTVKLAAILSKANEEAVAYDGSRKPEKPLTEGELLSLTQDKFYAVKDEIVKACIGDAARTVEIEPPKKKETKKKTGKSPSTGPGSDSTGVSST